MLISEDNKKKNIRVRDGRLIFTNQPLGEVDC